MTKSEARSMTENSSTKQNLEFSFLYKAAHYTEFLNFSAIQISSRIILCRSGVSYTLQGD